MDVSKIVGYKSRKYGNKGSWMDIPNKVVEESNVLDPRIYDHKAVAWGAT